MNHDLVLFSPPKMFNNYNLRCITKKNCCALVYHGKGFFDTETRHYEKIILAALSIYANTRKNTNKTQKNHGSSLFGLICMNKATQMIILCAVCLYTISLTN